MECETLKNVTTAAGTTAAISVFFNPVIGAVFGAVAGYGAFMMTRYGCM